MSYLIEKYLGEAKQNWSNNMVKAMLPNFNDTKDMVYLSKEVMGKSDYIYTKLIPNEKSTLETDQGTFTTLKKSGKGIHSDDFQKQIEKAKKNKSKIYIINFRNADIDGSNVLPLNISAYFDGVAGKWVESGVKQNNIGL